MRKVGVMLLAACAVMEGGLAFAQWNRAAQLMQRVFTTTADDEVKIALRHAQTLLESGKWDDAERVLRETARRQSAPRSPLAQAMARDLFEAAEAVRIERARRPPPPALPPGIELPSPEALFRDAAALRIAPEVPAAHRTFAVSLHEAVGRRQMVVTRKQAQFVRPFWRGATRPGWYLPRTEHARRWMSVDARMRIGIIGSKFDSPRLRQFAAEREAQGFVVFFYKDFDCSPEEVGAYMATAGEVIVSLSLDAADSAFVGLETTLAQLARAGERGLMVFTPGELGGIALGSSGLIGVTILQFDVA